MIQSKDINEVTVVNFSVRKLQNAEEINNTFLSIHDLIDARGRRKLVLNLSKVEYLSSFVLGKLLVMMKKVEEAGGRMFLCHVSPHIQMIFQSASKPLFDIYDNEHDALKSF